MSDPAWFRGQGIFLTAHRWFVDPLALPFCGVSIPGAQHPPAYPVYLAATYEIGLRSELAARLATAALGVATAIVLALVARRLAGRRAGWVAGLLAAVYPYFWGTEVQVLSEALFVLLVAVALLLAWSYARTPRLRSVVGLAVVIAVATLTRAEAALLYPFLVLPLVLGRRTVVARDRLRHLALAAVAAVLVVAPWVAYNLGRFDEPVVVSNGLGVTLAGANCPATYHGQLEGWWSLACLPRFTVGSDGRLRATARLAEPLQYCESPQVTTDESVRDRVLRDYALRYARAHASDVPRVVAARLGRMYALYHPWETVRIERYEGRRWGQGAQLGYLAIVPFAIGGALVLRRRYVTLLPAVAVLAMTAVTAVTTYGHPRFRLAADAALVVLAGVAVAAVGDRLRAARTLAAPRPEAEVHA